MVLHQNNIEIPALFSFRPRVTRWHLTSVEVVDWAEESSGSLKPLMAFKPPTGKPQRKTGERVIVRVTLPVDVGRALGMGLAGAMLLDLYGESSSDVEIEMQRKELPAGLLRPDETPFSTPDIAGRDFVALVSDMQESTGILRHSSPGEKEKERNVWTMRESFFSLKPSISELKTFLNRWGMWNSERHYEANGFSLQSRSLALVVPDAIWRQREAYRKALEGSARSWLRKASPLTFSSLDEWPHFLVERSTCQSAIEATITVDHIRDAKYGFCKRCRAMFERDTLHKKSYCSRKCIQADATARWRANQRKQAKKQGGKKNAKG